MDVSAALAPVLSANTIATILDNVRKALGTWGGIIVSILGAAALIVAAYKIVSGLMSHGKQPTNWLVVIGLIIVGGLFVTLGFTSWANMTSTGDANQILNQTVTYSSGGGSGWMGGGGE